jgi:hypothetical protein
MPDTQRRWHKSSAVSMDTLCRHQKGGVLVALVAEQVVAAGETINIGTARYLAVEGGRGRLGLVMGTLVSVAILGIEEALVADGALVRPLRAAQVGPAVTSASGQHGGGQCHTRTAHLRSQERSNDLPQPSTGHGKPPGFGAWRL